MTGQIPCSTEHSLSIAMGLFDNSATAGRITHGG